MVLSVRPDRHHLPKKFVRKDSIVLLARLKNAQRASLLKLLALQTNQIVNHVSRASGATKVKLGPVVKAQSVQGLMS